jgi:hypothetical protein
MCSDLAALIKVLSIVKKIAAVYQANWDERERKLKGTFLILRFSQLWRKRVKRWGGNDKKMQLARLKRAFAISVPCMIDHCEDKSIQMLKPFLLENKEKYKARVNVEKFFADIEFIQRSFKVNMASDRYKEEILDNYWGKIVFQLMTQRASTRSTRSRKSSAPSSTSMCTVARCCTRSPISSGG